MIRLLLAIPLFLVSLLTIFRAPTNFLWKLAVLTTEFPQASLGVTIGLFLSRFFISGYSFIGDWICFAAFGLYSTPLIRAYCLKQKIVHPALFAASLHPSSGYKFSLVQLFKFVNKKPIRVTTFNYKTVDCTHLDLDFYRSNSDKPSPCILLVHGGSWVSGDKREFPNLNYYLAQCGYHVAAFTYRLAPASQCPAPVEDTNDALEFLKTKADELGIDSKNFVLLGRSAGGQIALLAAYTLLKEKVKGVIAFYAPSDMVWASRVADKNYVIDSKKVLSEYIGGTYEQAPEKCKAASPLEALENDCPPTLLIHGRMDVVVSYEHSVRLNEKLNQKNIPHEFLSLPWANHACDFNIHGPSGQLSMQAIKTFLKSTIN